MNVDVPRLLVALGINAEQRGRELWAKCPYPCHQNDKDPSWSISSGGARNGLNNCFGCGSAGNAVELVMEVVGLSGYSAAVNWIKERSLDVDDPLLPNVRLIVSNNSTSNKVLDKPRFIFDEYSEWPMLAKGYISERKIELWQIDRWGIACSIDGKLAGRLWIPTYDRSGMLLNWTARTWCDDSDRYKSADGGGLPGALFGELHWPNEDKRRLSRLVICEGELNALACERAGAEYIAALGGASKYDGWKAMKLANWGHITIATDPDEAGNRLATLISQLQRFRPANTIKIINLPTGKDCDDVWREDSNFLIEMLKNVG